MKCPICKGCGGWAIESKGVREEWWRCSFCKGVGKISFKNWLQRRRLILDFLLSKQVESRSYAIAYRKLHKKYLEALDLRDIVKRKF